MAGNSPDVTSNPRCIGLYSFTQFKASAVCFSNPLTTGRYVGIVRKNLTILTLCEVEIYSRENLAFGKQTDQTSTYRDCVSNRAVDGNSNTSLYAGSACASTKRATKPWWRVDLGREEPVSELYIVNRGDCCGVGLENFEIRVVPSQAPSAFTVVARNSTSIQASWQFPPVNARRGIITGFKLLYRKKDLVGIPTSLTINGGETRTKNVTGFEMYTEYEFRVFAFTSAGDGPKSSVKVQRTLVHGLEWSKQKPSSPIFAPNLRQGGITAKVTLPRFPGNAKFFQIVVIRLSSDYNGIVKSPGNFTSQDLLTYHDAHASRIPAAYVTFQFEESDFDMYQEFVIGNGALPNNKLKNMSNGSKTKYHNKPLQPNTNYRVFLRAFVFENVYISTDFVKIETKVPPAIIEDGLPTSVMCEKQTQCLLYCHATSETSVHYFWTKNGQGLDSDRTKVMNNSIVVIPRDASDYGMYVCNAANSFGSASYEITLMEGHKLSGGETKNKRVDGLSKLYGATVIALSCTVFVLLIVIGLLICRLRQAVLNKGTPAVGTDTYDDVNEHDSPPRDQHVPEGDSYMELQPSPLQLQSHANSEYQSLQGTDVSSAYYNVGFAQFRNLEGQPHATSGCQSLQGTNISSAYYNVGFITGNSEQDSEVYYEIGNIQR